MNRPGTKRRCTKCNGMGRTIVDLPIHPITRQPMLRVSNTMVETIQCTACENGWLYNEVKSDG
jgi:hypothetical protein